MPLADILSERVEEIFQREIRPIAGAFKTLQDGVILDVGANTGAWTKAWLSMLGERTAQCHLFEPQAEARLYTDGLDLFDATERAKITCHRVALGAACGNRRLYTDLAGSALASLYKRDISGWPFHLGLEEEVQVTRLDPFCAAQGLSRIDLLKVDVEGAELEVLQGAEGLLAAGAISSILFEFGSPNVHSGVFFLAIWKLLNAHDYAIFSLCEKGEGGISLISDYSYELEKFDTVQMFFAQRRS